MEWRGPLLIPCGNSDFFDKEQWDSNTPPIEFLIQPWLRFIVLMDSWINCIINLTQLSAHGIFIIIDCYTNSLTGFLLCTTTKFRVISYHVICKWRSEYRFGLKEFQWKLFCGQWLCCNIKSLEWAPRNIAHIVYLLHEIHYIRDFWHALCLLKAEEDKSRNPEAKTERQTNG